MNFEKKTPLQAPAISPESVEGSALTAQAHDDFHITKKPQGFLRPKFVIGGMALCMGLASCVVPHDSMGGGSVTVSSYSPGYTVASLPGGYRTERISGSTYYYHDGSYFRQGSGGYVVVDAPRTSRYYTEYSSRQQNRSYSDASNRRGQLSERSGFVNRLPSGYQVVNHSGRTYYRAGDRYYSRQGGGYLVVSSPY